MNTVIVIPVYNEAKAVGQVIKDVRAHGFPHIIVVDDGARMRAGLWPLLMTCWPCASR